MDMAETPTPFLQIAGRDCDGDENAFDELKHGIG
ncbi:hypothetical protein FHT86_004556 [Rhizobium sp. BK313]|nr:hypothetical protein [Rhizobium sp. BK313]